jgi:hypothetical protein
MNLQQKDNSKIIQRKMNYLGTERQKEGDNSTRDELSITYLFITNAGLFAACPKLRHSRDKTRHVCARWATAETARQGQRDSIAQREPSCCDMGPPWREAFGTAEGTVTL